MTVKDIIDITVRTHIEVCIMSEARDLVGAFPYNGLVLPYKKNPDFPEELLSCEVCDISVTMVYSDDGDFEVLDIVIKESAEALARKMGDSIFNLY